MYTIISKVEIVYESLTISKKSNHLKIDSEFNFQAHFMIL
jgi:hypothetical protein